jgi:hypothetical protein
MRLGIRTAKAGNRTNARVIFQQILATDKRNEHAWLWMASLAETSTDRRRYLETVLQLNPDNNTAKKQLSMMDKEIQRVENRSISFGVKILLALVAVLVIVGLAIYVFTTLVR